MVIALKDLKGRQMDYGRFRFSWTISENEENAYFVWIYKENVSIPVMISYSQCINHCMEVSFQSDNLDMESINSTRFLIFVTDSRRELSGRTVSYKCILWNCHSEMELGLYKCRVHFTASE